MAWLNLFFRIDVWEILDFGQEKAAFAFQMIKKEKKSWGLSCGLLYVKKKGELFD